MSVYSSCRPCSGFGGFKCAQCRCSTCNSTGKVQQQCSVCHGTSRVTCQNCSGSGQVLKKKGWFSDKYDACYRCKGSRQEQCGSCKQGYKEATCQTCKGTGAAANCSNCHGQGKTPCADCSGSGRVRPNWSPDRIREEIAQRRSAMRQEEEALQWFTDDYNARPYLYEKDGFGGRGNERAISRLNEEIAELVSWL